MSGHFVNQILSLSFPLRRYDPAGCWTVRDCTVVYRNTSHVRCQCQRLGTFGVLMDSSQREVSVLSVESYPQVQPHIYHNYV